MAVVTVIGGGVIGYTCAIRLAEAGHAVRVLTADDPADTTSAIAAAIWFPYLAEPMEAALRWGAVALRVFTELAADPRTGVRVLPGVVVHRTPDPDLRWTSVITDVRPTRPDELPPGTNAATACTVPVIDTGRYLPWLRDRAHRGGVVTERREIGALSDVTDADVVVVAAGLRSSELCGDGQVYPVRGQVVRVADAGLTRWVLDDENAGGLTYIVPRLDDVVCGGTAEPGETDTTIDPVTEAAILARAIALEPRLAGAAVLSRAVGLRPARSTVRLEAAVVDGRRTVYCYGHGGAGVTLSWGCAAEVAGLAVPAPGCEDESSDHPQPE